MTRNATRDYYAQTDDYPQCHDCGTSLWVHRDKADAVDWRCENCDGRWSG